MLAILLVTLDSVYPGGVELKAFATPLVTVAALLLAYHQWRHLRNEATLVGSLQQLEIVNTYFRNIDDSAVRYFFGGPNAAGWAEGADDPGAWNRTMYVFMELDKLQFALEKYRLGYSAAYPAVQVVDMFAQRCGSEAFLATAKRLVKPRVGGYFRETREVVSRLTPGFRIDPSVL